MSQTKRTPGTGLTEELSRWAKEQDATVVIGRDQHGEWSLMSNFGKEAPDSPMAGGSLIGAGMTLTAAIEGALSDARINPCAKCGWERACEGGEECHS